MGSFLSNDSWFGKLMNKVWIVICTNILFCVCSLPIFTFGASFTAMYHVLFKTFRLHWEVSPFKEFFKGFKNNFKQSTISWLIEILLILVVYADVQLCEQAGGSLIVVQYLLYGIFAAILILTLYYYPTMACFNGSMGALLKDSVYFAIHKPLYLLIILAVTVIPQMYTYADPDMYALYGFFWVTCGYALIALLCAWLLLKEFTPYLPEIDDITQIRPD